MTQITRINPCHPRSVPLINEMKSDRLQVAVIGLGVGEQHARAYLNHERCELRWIWDLDESKMDQSIKDLGGGRKARSFEELVADPDLNVASIASYDDAHYEQVLALLRARKHVFVEKPLCRSLDELQRIRDTWRAPGGRHLAVNLVLRSAPLYVWLRSLIRSGELGDIYAFDGDYLYGRLQKITEGWRRDVTDYSVMQGGGVHLVDLMLWLTGQRPTAVSALGNRISTAGTGFQYDDYVAATFRFSSGLVGRITANFGCIHRHQHVVRVFGTKGVFIYDDAGPRLHSSAEPNQPSHRITLSPLSKTKGDLIPAFIDAIVTGKDTSLETQHEFDVMSACIGADRALEQARTMEITYI